jgi:hypothetical protein
MTVASDVNRADYTADGVLTTFAYPFKLFASADVLVYDASVLKTLNTDYTVTGVGADGGGNIVFTYTPVNGHRVTFLRSQPYTQDMDLVQNDPFPAATVEAAHDKAVILTQQLKEKLGRALALADSSTITGVVLPEPGAGLVFRWNAAGTAVELVATSILGGAVNPIIAQGDLIRGGATAIPERIALGSNGQVLAVLPASAKPGYVDGLPAALTNKTGGTLSVGDVVAVSTANDKAAKLDDAVASLSNFVVALETPVADVVGNFLVVGLAPVVKAQGAIARGQYVRKSATSKAVEDAGVAYSSSATAPAGALGVALTAAAGGFVSALWYEVPSPGPVTVNQCRVTKSGANLTIGPFMGNRLTFPGGVQAVVPAVGTVTLGTGGLGASTTYNIYAVQTAGVVTSLEASATAHATDAGSGIEIKSGDTTRVLVGQARTTAGTAWADSDAQRFVISYFNRRGVTSANNFTANRSTASTTFTEINTEIRIECLTWPDEDVAYSFGGFIQSSASAVPVYAAVAIDSTTVADDGGSVNSESAVAVNYRSGAFAGSKNGLSEGYHFFTIVGRGTSGTTVTFYGSGSPGDGTRGTLRLRLRG